TPPLGVASIEVLDLHLLDVSRIRKHDGTKGNRSRRCVDRPCKALLQEFWKQAAVVDMGVRENDCVHRGGVERKLAIVQRLLRLGALKHSAVDDKPSVADLKLVTGAGHAMRGTVEAQRWLHVSFPPLLQSREASSSPGSVACPRRARGYSENAPQANARRYRSPGCRRRQGPSHASP